MNARAATLVPVPVLEWLENRVLLSGGGPRLHPTATSIVPSDFGAVVDNPYMPLIPGTTYSYQGTQAGSPSTDDVTVTTETKQILGVTTTVVRDNVFVNGQLAEQTDDWYAQDKAGNVWYFGEDTKELSNGVVTSTEGTWQAGVNGAQPGIVMEAQPRKGDKYLQEFAQGVAEDRAAVLSLHAKMATPFGAFGDVLETNDFSLLEPGVVEHKFFARGIGFVGSVMVRGGKEVSRLTAIDAGPEAFGSTIDNAYLPLTSGTTYVYGGTKDGSPARDEVTITNQTRQILGVTTTVVQDNAFVNGQLAEQTQDWYAQDKLGNVWYFGEDTKELSNGVVTSTQGTWQAGVNGAKAGIVMLAHPAVGTSYGQEFAAGVAEDRAAVLRLRRRVAVPFRAFSDALETSDFSLLERGVDEHKFYAPGIGFIASVMVRGGHEVMKLVLVTP